MAAILRHIVLAALSALAIAQANCKVDRVQAGDWCDRIAERNKITSAGLNCCWCDELTAAIGKAEEQPSTVRRKSCRLPTTMDHGTSIRERLPPWLSYARNLPKHRECLYTSKRKSRKMPASIIPTDVYPHIFHWCDGETATCCGKVCVHIRVHWPVDDEGDLICWSDGLGAASQTTVARQPLEYWVLVVKAIVQS
ncbi:hypothetical protein BC832DRAFT_538048 [Gaertneriomyces semiglobifer]|nr:hypothetical protein BC832DRAFT_538048 [Gaertneriomyces semiglobifer]